MKFLKGNQVIIYIIAFLLITAGYLNYTDNKKTEEVSGETNSVNIADIGDATLVNSNEVVSQNITENQIVKEVNKETKANILSENTNNTNNENETITTNTTSDYFTNTKLEREKMYSQMIEVYEKVLNSSNSDTSQKQIATEELKKINETKNSIMICENLIKTQGYNNNVILVNGDSINVIVEATTLEKENVAQIQNIIQREMKAEATNIHIATK